MKFVKRVGSCVVRGSGSGVACGARAMLARGLVVLGCAVVSSASLSGCEAFEPSVMTTDPIQTAPFSVTAGFPAAQRPFDAFDLMVFDRQAGGNSGAFKAMVSREGFNEQTGQRVAPDPGSFEFRGPAPTLRIRRGWGIIRGFQPIAETDRTTTHSSGSKFLIWARQPDPADPNSVRTDVIFALEHDCCVTPGQAPDVLPAGCGPGGVVVPAGSFVTARVVVVNGVETVVIDPPNPINQADRKTADFLAYAEEKARQMGVW